MVVYMKWNPGQMLRPLARLLVHPTESLCLFFIDFDIFKIAKDTLWIIELHNGQVDISIFKVAPQAAYG
jgi:hypothetical protein